MTFCYRKLFWVEHSRLMSKIRYTQLDGSYHRQGFSWQSAPVLWESRELNSQSPLVLDPASGDLYFTQHRHDLTWIMVANHQAKTIRLSHICSGNVTQFYVIADKVFWHNTSSICWNQNHTVKNDLQNYKIVSFKHSSKYLFWSIVCIEFVVFISRY